jgi:glycogen phosphorylase
LKQYVEQHYLSAAACYHRRAAGWGYLARQLNEWRAQLDRNWKNLKFGEVRVHSFSGSRYFCVPLQLAELEPDAVQVELYAEGLAGEMPERHTMHAVQLLSERNHIYMYCAELSSKRPEADYTPRACPHHNDVSAPLETPMMLWQR